MTVLEPSPQREAEAVTVALGQAAAGARLDAAAAEKLLSARGDDFERLLAIASATRDAGLAASGRSGVITYSRKVFVPLTTLCRDRCHYCIFVDTPGQLLRQRKPAFMSESQVLAVVRQGAAMGCKEALLTLGDRPEDRWPEARAWLDDHGFASTLDYVGHIARLITAETGMLAHLNPGVMSAAEMRMLRPTAPSMGMMLETTSRRLYDEPGQVHYGSPDKDPEVRLAVIEDAGRERVPFTTGVLIGIGETVTDRAESLIALRDAHERHGHVQEVIVQNFRAKPRTAMQAVPDASLYEYVAAVAVARLVMGPHMRIQVPPNLSDSAEFHLLVRAGADDWGGVSPLTADHVNPERPWPHLDDLAARTAELGFALTERLTTHPEFVRDAATWIDPALHDAVAVLADPATGLARTSVPAPATGLARTDSEVPAPATGLPRTHRELFTPATGRPRTHSEVPTAVGAPAGPDADPTPAGSPAAKPASAPVLLPAQPPAPTEPIPFTRTHPEKLMGSRKVDGFGGGVGGLRGDTGRGAAAAAEPTAAGSPRGPGVRELAAVAASDPLALDDAEWVALLNATGDDLDALTATADDVRRYTVGEAVSLVVNRNLTSSGFRGTAQPQAGTRAETPRPPSPNPDPNPNPDTTDPTFTLDDVGAIAADAWDLGASELCVQGRLPVTEDPSAYLDIARAVKAAAPRMHLHAYRPQDVWDLADRAGHGLDGALRALRDAGVDSIPGTGVKVLSERVRRLVAPDDIEIDRWTEAVTTAHRRGIRSTSVLFYGHVETAAERIAHLRLLRAIQTETGGFTEFVPIPLPGHGVSLVTHRSALDEARAMVAVSRLLLSGSIAHIQIPWPRIGRAAAARLLQSGGDDLGGTLLDGRVKPGAGIEAGHELPVADAAALAARMVRPLRVRTTSYGEPAREAVLQR